MKKTLKVMLAALLSLAMVLTFAGAADLEAPVTATAPADDVAITIHAEDGALDVFTDAPEKDNWSYEALNCIVANELIKGNNSLVMPSSLLSRAEMTTIMVRVLGAESLSANISKYIDVARNEWYYDAISSGVATKIIEGNGNKMMPKDSITREQAMAILARTFLFEAESNATATFKDKANISAWALESANALVERGIVLGDSNGNLRPQSNITRAEFATMLHRIVCYFAKADVAYAGKTIKGSVILDDANVDLSGVTIDGDLYIVEGVGNAKIDLSDVTVTGNIVIRGGDVTVAEGASVIRKEDVVEDKPVVVPPVVDNKGDTTDRETPNVSTTPNGADVTPIEIDETGTYVSYGDPEKKEFAEVTSNTITFDLRGKVNTDDVLHTLYVDANKTVAIKASKFEDVNYKTNIEIPVKDLLEAMVSSTNLAFTEFLNITENAEMKATDYKYGQLAEIMSLASSLYNSDSDDGWAKAIFHGYAVTLEAIARDGSIVVEGTLENPIVANKANFIGTIGGEEYTISLIVDEPNV